MGKGAGSKGRGAQTPGRCVRARREDIGPPVQVPGSEEASARQPGAHAVDCGADWRGGLDRACLCGRTWELMDPSISIFQGQCVHHYLCRPSWNSSRDGEHGRF